MQIAQSKLELFGTDGTTDVTPAPVLTYADIQNHLKLDGSADQADVSAMIAGATQMVEKFIDRKLVTQHWSIYFDFFPRKYKKEEWWDGMQDGHVSSLYNSGVPIELPFGPCQSISWVRGYDETDGTIAVDASNYSVDNIGIFGRIALKTGGQWPSATLRPVNGVHVRGVFGIGSASAVPQDIKQALKITVASMYENRGDGMKAEGSSLGLTLPNTAAELLQSYRRWKVR